MARVPSSSRDSRVVSSGMALVRAASSGPASSSVTRYSASSRVSRTSPDSMYSGSARRASPPGASDRSASRK